MSSATILAEKRGLPVGTVRTYKRTAGGKTVEYRRMKTERGWKHLSKRQKSPPGFLGRFKYWLSETSSGIERRRRAAKFAKTLDNLRMVMSDGKLSRAATLRRALFLAGGQHFPKGTQVELTVYKDDESASIRLEHHNFGVSEVTIRPFAKVVYLEYIQLNQQGKGTGFRIFESAVRTAQKMGYKAVNLHAARRDASEIDDFDPYGTMNGYYTWARMGANTSLSDGLAQARVQPPPERRRELLRKYETLGEAIARSPRFRKWWYENGDGLYLKFDLTPGSTSWKIFRRYMREKGYKPSKDLRDWLTQEMLKRIRRVLAEKRGLPAGTRRPYKSGKHTYERVKQADGSWKHIRKPARKGKTRAAAAVDRAFSLEYKALHEAAKRNDRTAFEKSVTRLRNMLAADAPKQVDIPKKVLDNIRQRFPKTHQYPVIQSLQEVLRMAHRLNPTVPDYKYVGGDITLGLGYYDPSTQTVYLNSRALLDETVFGRNSITSLKSTNAHELGHHIHSTIFLKSPKYQRALSQLRLSLRTRETPQIPKRFARAVVQERENPAHLSVSSYSLVSYISGETEMFSTGMGALMQPRLALLAPKHIEWTVRLLRGENPIAVTRKWLESIRKDTQKKRQSELEAIFPRINKERAIAILRERKRQERAEKRAARQARKKKTDDASD